MKVENEIGKAIVTFQENMAINLANFLDIRGFDVCDNVGIKLDSYYIGTRTSIGILERKFKRGNIFRRYFFRQRNPWIGIIYFHPGNPHAIWIIDVYGKNNIATIWDLAKTLAVIFGVSIDIKLMDENTRQQVFPSDFDY